MSFVFPLLAFPALEDLESLALSRSGLQTSPSASSGCWKGSVENPALDLACLEDRYLAVTQESPQIFSNDPAPHCGRGTGLFSDRVYVTHGKENLLELNASPDPQAPWTRIRCEVPTLWQASHPGATQVLESSLLEYFQVRGKTVWVPDYLCNTFSYQGYTIHNKKDFTLLLKQLEQPFVNEDRNAIVCYSSPETPLEPSEDYFASEVLVSELLETGLELSLSVGTGALAGMAIGKSFSKIGSAFSKAASKVKHFGPSVEGSQEKTTPDEELDCDECEDFEDDEDSLLEDDSDSV